MDLKLFNISEHPGERNDLASQKPEKVKELQAAYLKWYDENIK